LARPLVGCRWFVFVVLAAGWLRRPSANRQILLVDPGTGPEGRRFATDMGAPRRAI
jgi:hypothetical protein